MAHPRPLLVPLGRIVTNSLSNARPAVPTISYQTIRCASAKTKPQAPKQNNKKKRNTFRQYDTKRIQQFSLVDAMQYIRAFEVGRSPTSSKYEMHVRLRTLKNGPTLRNRLRLPHAVNTDIRICVIAPPGSKAAAEAQAAGAALVGEDDVIAMIKEGKIEFERCICHSDSIQKMNKAGLGRILGPRGLMPSTKTGTVVTNVEATLKTLVGGSEYRERDGVVRMAVGQLGFTPEELQTNIQKFMEFVKKDISGMSDRISKEIHEVVLSSTNAPGFTLNGEFRDVNSISPKELATPM